MSVEFTEQDYKKVIDGPSNMVKLKVGASKTIHILYNYEHRRPVAASYLLSTINSLTHRHINCYPQFSIDSEKNAQREFKLPRDWDSRRGWEWQFDIKLQEFIHLPDKLSWKEIADFQLTFEKAACLDKVHTRINNVRRYYVNEINAQHTVYRIKADEAKSFLKNPVDKPSYDDYPFLVSYCKITGVDADLAAREILIQAEFAESRLVETEILRIKYSRAIHSAESVLELRGIINDFYREAIGHATA